MFVCAFCVCLSVGTRGCDQGWKGLGEGERGEGGNEGVWDGYVGAGSGW